MRKLSQLGTAVRARAAERGRAVGPAVRLGVSETELKKLEAEV